MTLDVRKTLDAINMTACYGTEEDPEAARDSLLTIGEIARKAIADIETAQPTSEPRAQPSAEPTLVRAARDALACMREYSSKADEDCGDPGCGECNAMRPTWAALDTLRRALDASDGAGDARDAARWETRTELAQVRARVAELEARKP